MRLQTLNTQPLLPTPVRPSAHVAFATAAEVQASFSGLPASGLRFGLELLGSTLALLGVWALKHTRTCRQGLGANSFIWKFIASAPARAMCSPRGKVTKR